ncbi:helix-turn-helix transcriptional regulator [Halorubrum sp. LN27]|uniref:PadR family transcriptional regulator n=1 Tax=Halorubrum sp. LN27 TaxID=2801032 RepID=UPI00190931B3|nr:helix-turn-helix transcriptional regulator [Halorubrum sp. LN27]
MSTDSTTPTDTETHRIRHTDLTAFHFDLLAVCARLEAGLDNVHGLAIKDGLQDIHGEEINHGRLYPNLDELDEKGLIEKRAQEIDARTNAYRVTKEGFRLLDQRRFHLASAVDGGA